jgi:tRNA(Ile)-lysidine synthase
VPAWDWRAQPQLALAAGGALALVPDQRGEVDLRALPCPLSVCFRRGGERLPRGAGHLALKDLLQQHGIAPWLRAVVPLLASGERIIAVADLWLDACYRVRSGGEPQRASGARDPALGARARLRWRRPQGDGD